MDLGVAVIVAVLGSTGLFGLVQFLINRHDGKDRSLAQIKHQLNAIEDKCDRNELAITRVQLLFLISDSPNDKETILTTAQRYFVELNGNGEAWAVFYAWAKPRKINLDWYKTLLAREKGKKNAEYN